MMTTFESKTIHRENENNTENIDHSTTMQNQVVNQPRNFSVSITVLPNSPQFNSLDRLSRTGSTNSTGNVDDMNSITINSPTIVIPVSTTANVTPLRTENNTTSNTININSHANTSISLLSMTTNDREVSTSSTLIGLNPQYSPASSTTLNDMPLTSSSPSFFSNLPQNKDDKMNETDQLTTLDNSTNINNNNSQKEDNLDKKKETDKLPSFLRKFHQHRTQKNKKKHQPQAPKRPISHFGVLDGIRGLSTLVVLIFHSASFSIKEQQWNPFSSLIATSGHVMVRWFYVLSAYLLSYISLKRWNTVVTKNVKSQSLIKQTVMYAGFWCNYWIARVSRVFPLMMVVAAFIIYVPVIAESYYTTSEAQTFYQILSMEERPHVLWSLYVEFQYYKFIPLFVVFYQFITRFPKIPSKVTPITFILVWGFLFVQVFVPSVRLMNISLPEKFLGSNGFMNFFPVFLGGSMAGACQFEIEDGKFLHKLNILTKTAKWLKKLYIVSLISIISISLTFFFDNYHYNNKTSSNYIPYNFEYDGLLVGLSFLCATNHKEALLNKIMDSSVLVFYGKISFALYILHPIFLRYTNVIWNIPKWILNRTQDDNVSNTGLDNMLIVLLMTTIVSYLSTRFFELPLMTWSKKLDMTKIPFMFFDWICEKRRQRQFGVPANGTGSKSNGAESGTNPQNETDDIVVVVNDEKFQEEKKELNDSFHHKSYPETFAFYINDREEQQPSHGNGNFAPYNKRLSLNNYFDQQNDKHDESNSSYSLSSSSSWENPSMKWKTNKELFTLIGEDDAEPIQQTFTNTVGVKSMNTTMTPLELLSLYSPQSSIDLLDSDDDDKVSIPLNTAVQQSFMNSN